MEVGLGTTQAHRALLLPLASGLAHGVVRSCNPGHFETGHVLSLLVPLCSCGAWDRMLKLVYRPIFLKLTAQATQESSHCQVLQQGHYPD